MRHARIILLMLFALAVIAASFALPPLYDESYYWTWSRDLSLSYVDHPPGIAFILAASSKLFGDGLFGLRAPSLVSMIGILALSGMSAARLAKTHGRRSVWLAILVFFLMAVLMVSNIRYAKPQVSMKSHFTYFRLAPFAIGTKSI